MSFIIVKGKGTIALDNFAWNDLPVKKKLKNGKRVFSDAMFRFDNSHCDVFETVEKAAACIDFIKNEINRNSSRYESAVEGSTEKLMQIANKLRVVERDFETFDLE